MLRGVVLAVVLAGVIPQARALDIELHGAGADRIERQRAFERGDIPLPGTPDTGKLAERLVAAGVEVGAPIFLRIFKAESELELWMRKDDGLVLVGTYPICQWSGNLGPKLSEGDRQTPEGFYTVTRNLLHMGGRWPRSLNIGFPNEFDRSLRRTGSYILIHGGCASVGCFAMTNEVIAEIFELTEQALRGGQERIQVHVFPFRMTDTSLADYEMSPWLDFWKSLKPAYDAFEQARRVPRIGICETGYAVASSVAGAERVADPGPIGRWQRRVGSDGSDLTEGCDPDTEATTIATAPAVSDRPQRSRINRRAATADPEETDLTAIVFPGLRAE